MLLARTFFRGAVAIAFLLSYRYFSKDQQGMLDTAITWTNAVMTLSDLGMSTLIVKHASQKHAEADRYFGNAMFIQAVMSLVIFVGLLITGAIVGFSMQLLLLLALIGSAGLIFEWRKVIRGILRAQMRIKEIAITETLNGLFFVIAILGIFAFVENRAIGLIGFGITQLVVNTLSIGLLFWHARKLLTPRLDPPRIFPMLRESIHFTLYNTFEMLYVQVGLIILSIMRNPTTVATYGGASRIVTLCLFVPMTLYQVLLPALYAYAKNDEAQYKRLSRMTIFGFGGAGLVFGLIFFFFSDPLVPLILGKQYQDTIPVMQWLSVFLMLRFVSIALTNILITRNQEKYVAYTQVTTVLAMILLVLALIPRFEAVGPAMAASIVETGNILMLSFLAWKYGFSRRDTD
jgi:O-antigen/teichoic acid export membrane protein